MFNMVLCNAAVFIFLQNYEYLKTSFDSLYYDKDKIAKCYALEFSGIDAQDSNNSHMDFITDVINRTPMYAVGKKVYKELEDNPHIYFYENCVSGIHLDNIENGEKLLPFIDEEQPQPEIHIEFVNENNFTAWNLKIVEGRDFDTDDFENLNRNNPVSVILGNDFRSVYKIGDTIKIRDEYFGDDSAVVIGFLNKGAYKEEFGQLYSMDNYMFCPIIFPRDESGIRDYEELDGLFLDKHRRVLVDDPSIDLQSLVNEVTTKNGFYTLVCSALDGTEKKETEEIARRNVFLIGSLATIGGVICTLSLATILYNRAFRNRSKYCIFMCSGIPIWKINISITLEMLILLVISIFPTIGLSIYEYGKLYVPVWQIIVFTLPIIFVSLIPTFMVNRKCNLDILIRDKIV
ncbi:MAG: ABC transporter permease [Clostridiales bacterium]|nr:ABC transporter permease [Clostridiales bacterium]